MGSKAQSEQWWSEEQRTLCNPDKDQTISPVTIFTVHELCQQQICDPMSGIGVAAVRDFNLQQINLSKKL